MRIDNLEYFWGLFDSPEDANAASAMKHVHFEAPDVPIEVEHSFVKERIAELTGEYGLPGVGEPTEVDSLVVISGGKKTAILVENRGISLFQAETDELLRLHRFFCILQGRTGSRKNP
ncbi:MAG: hypothetical protein ACE5OP_07175 [Candidatus Glassbacteria bacterium]